MTIKAEVKTMALKSLFDMVKADRYTQDGREALIKAQEEETEDKVYQIGEISQKTGLQKTANGWVKPKSGKQPGAKKENPTRTFEFKSGPDGMPVAGSGKEVKTYKTKKEAEAALKKQNAAAENKTTIRQGPKTKTLNETPAEPESKGSDIPDFKGMESGDYDKKLRAEGWTTGGWEGNGTHASAIFKKGDRTIRVNEGQPGKITSVQEISKPAEKLPAKPTRGMSESYIRGTQLMKPAEDESQRGEQHWAGVLSGYDNTSVLEQRKQLQEKYDEFEEDIKDYDRIGLAPAVYAKRINQQNFLKGALKAIDDEMENRGMDPAPRTSVPDAAPRVLTGDTRIRVRKA